MYLPSDRYEEIKTIVIEMFKRYDIRNIPIDCFEITTKMGIILKPYSRLAKDGIEAALAESNDGFCLLRREGFKPFMVNQWYIFYNDTLPRRRIRFTLMHEIGHVVLDHLQESDLAESEANFFAKYALAPPPLVNEISPEDYMELGSAFDLSNQFARHAFSYYEKWLNNGEKFYRSEELELIEQFELSEYLQ